MSQWTPNDQQSWSLTEAQLRDDGPTGVNFLAFLNFLLGTAEKMITDNAAKAQWEDDNRQPPTVTELSAANAIRQALEVTESRLGFIDVHFLGQMLVCAGTYWDKGPDMLAGLSVIEVKITGEALARKIADLQTRAAEDENDDHPSNAGDDQLVGGQGQP